MHAVPVPPVDQTLGTTGQAVLTVVTAVVAVVALSLIVRMARRERTVWPIVIGVGGILCLGLEPIYDNLFNIWFYDAGDIWKAYTSYGMVQPVWVPITYVWCYGSLAIYAARRVDRGLTRAGAWRLAGVFMVVYTIFEFVGINLGVYEYYGPHPFRVFNFPVWVSVSNGSIGMIAGILIARLRPLLAGRQIWALVPVVPAVFAMVSFGGSFPALVAMNAPDAPTAVIWLAAIASMALEFSMLHLASLLLPAAAPVLADETVRHSAYAMSK
jgi:hypothetical protein